MWALLISTILTSAADSLNPFAITQQFVLQSMVKKPKLVKGYGQVLFTAELILVIAFLIGVGDVLQSNEIELLKKQIRTMKVGKNAEKGNDEAEAVRKIKSVSPMALVALGVGAMISELTTACCTLLFWQFSLITSSRLFKWRSYLSYIIRYTCYP